MQLLALAKILKLICQFKVPKAETLLCKHFYPKNKHFIKLGVEPKIVKEMKSNRLKLLALLLSVIPLFFGCSSDDDPEFDGSLIGTWRMTSMDYEGEGSTEVQGIGIMTTFDGVGKNLDVIMTFTESPNEFVTAGSYDVELNYSTFGQTESETISIDDFESGGTWSISGNKLTFDGDLFPLPIDGETGMDENGLGEMVIEKLDETTLRLGVEAVEEFTQDGVDVTATITSTLEFTRE